ncbi:Amine oxidase [flavin-containing] A [Lachnellula occidentalis]|uniref:Amine oxidase n=1 Tax=Lachnellula occidentalis TaxID=215460 RepID=A0A8H8UBH4_9HELO|nr:Amine oxidase [flavin-containing] A [Lachnellula occidentalis]
MAPHVTTIDSSALKDCKPYYSPVATVQGPVKFIYTAGQVGRDKNGVVPENYEEEVELAFQNPSDALLAAGATAADIVKVTYYIVNYSPENRYHAQVLLKFMNGHRPPSTLVPVPALAVPEYHFEIEAVAAVRDLTAIPPIVRPAALGSLNIDVVVVGGGLSGLQAAHDVQKAGYSCVVLEARDRVGGKTWSRPTKGGSIVDVGAAWINDSNQSKMFALTKKFNLELIEQNTNGNCAAHVPEKEAIVFRYGEVPAWGEKDVADIVRIRDGFEELCHTIDIRNPWAAGNDDLTLEEFVKAQGAGVKAMATVAIWSRAMLGCEPSELSALYFLDYCKSGGGLLQMRSDQKNGGQHLRLRTETMVPGSVILEAPVSRIFQSRSGVAIVTTEDGTRYHAKKVVVSIPTPTYKQITFQPPLPLDKLKYSSNSMLGYYAKMILIWDKPWWRKGGYCGMTQSFVGPASVTRDTSDDLEGQFSLTCFLVGQPGRDWSKLSAAGRKEAILSQLVALFGFDNEADIRAPTEIFEQEWVKDPWSQGCPCPVTPPNIMSDVGKALREPFDAIHFVGTETSFEWKGYMEGAIRSGERGAAEVVEALSNKGTKAMAKL